jgi:hypothetical protein
LSYQASEVKPTLVKVDILPFREPSREKAHVRVSAGSGLCFLHQGFGISHVKDLTTATIRLHALQKWLLRNYSGWFLSQSMYSSTPLDVILWSVAHVFLDPGDFHVRIRPEWEKGEILLFSCVISIDRHG